jgi:hypothetical protein
LRPDGQARGRAELDGYVAFVVELSSDNDHSAEHRRLAEPLAEHVQVSHPVQERHHHGPRPDGRCDLGDGLVQRGRLDRQQHDVGGLGQFSGQDQVRPHRLPVVGSSPRPHDPQPVLAQLPATMRADQEGDIPAGPRQPCPEIATGGARPNDQDRHGLSAPSASKRTKLNVPKFRSRHSGWSAFQVLPRRPPVLAPCPSSSFTPDLCLRSWFVVSPCLHAILGNLW